MSKDKKTETVVLKQSALAAAEAILAGNDELVIEPQEDGSIKRIQTVRGEKIVMTVSNGSTPYDPAKPQGVEFK